MTKIWARRSSSAAQKVYWALAELSVPHEQINAGADYGVVNEPAYRAKNPNGRVPTLEEDDGFVLWESNAVVRYLADLHGRGSISPTDARARARSDSFMDWTSSTLEPPITGLWSRHKLGIERPGLQPDAVLLEASVQALNILASQLTPHGYLLADGLTIGDFPLGVLINRWFKLPIVRPELARISAYYELLSTRAPYREHVVATRPWV